MGIKSNQKVYIDLICYPLYTLGPGERAGLWFQGCDIGCQGCIATHTWEQTKEKEMDMKDLLLQLTNMPATALTISGGEPFNQPEALFELLENIRGKFNDILIYSGYEYNYLEKRYPEILDFVGVLVDGRFVKSLPSDKVYRGSSNQKMYLFNSQLLDIYSEYMVQENEVLQMHQTDQEIYVLGIPKSEDSNLIKKVLQET